MHRHIMTAALMALVAGCGYDKAPGPYDPPISSTNDGLWVASGISPAILRLAPPQLLASGRPTADATITTPSATLFTINSIAFDAAGDMWIASADDSRLIAFSSQVLAASGSTAASRIITAVDGSLDTPSAIAFDRQHRLWIANLGTGTIARFDAAQLSSSGAPQPAVVIRGPGRPSAIAFDASGSMWVANVQSSFIAKYSSAQLSDTGAVTPAVVLRALVGSFRNPLALAFDAAGNLWVAYAGSTNIVAFTPEQQAEGGTPDPQITLTRREGSFGEPVGLAFDDDGALWVVSAEGTLHKFAASQLQSTGAPVPSRALSPSGQTLLSGIAFWPKPGRLPLN